MPYIDLKRKALFGMFWISFGRFSTEIIKLVMKIFLARLLIPEEFGTAGIAAILIMIAGQFQDFGFGSALVHKKREIEKSANSIFTIRLMIGIILTFVCFFGANRFAEFYNLPAIASMTKVLSFTFIIGSLGAVPGTMLGKELRFKKNFLRSLGSLAVYSIIAIFLAYSGFGAWSIVWAHMGSTVAGTLLAWLFCEYRPKFEFDFSVTKKLFGYGKFIAITGFMGFIIGNGDDFVIGKVLGASAYAFYALAYHFSQEPLIQVSSVVNGVMWPIYCKLQNNKERMKRAYLRAVKLSALFSIPAAVGLFILARDIIYIIFGENWLPMVDVFRALCILVAIGCLGSGADSVYNAIGRPDINSKLRFLSFVIFLIVIYPLTKYYGLLGTVGALALMTAAGLIVSYIIFYKIFGAMIFRIYIMFGKIISSALGMGIGVYLMKAYVFINNINLVKLLALVFAGIILYLIINFIIDKEFRENVLEFKDIIWNKKIVGLLIKV